MIRVMRVTIYDNVGRRFNLRASDQFPSIKVAKDHYKREYERFNIVTVYLVYEEEDKCHD